MARLSRAAFVVLLAGAGVLSVAPDAGAEQLDFQFTGAPQSFTVPGGTCELIVEMRGAQGAGGVISGGPTIGPGGTGGRAVAVVPVSPGETLQILVGGAGSGRTGGFPDGGDGGAGLLAGGGGGSSRLVRAGAPLMVAAGGGGGGSSSSSGGGNGGGTTGTAGGSILLGAGGGGGATQSAGGAGGTGANPGAAGTAESGGVGGAGGAGEFGGGAGGGGGGGLFGGGGGGAGAQNALGAGGGGGSGFVVAGASGVTLATGGQTGNGEMDLTFGTDPGCGPAPVAVPPSPTAPAVAAQPRFTG